MVYKQEVQVMYRILGGFTVLTAWAAGADEGLPEPTLLFLGDDNAWVNHGC